MLSTGTSTLTTSNVRHQTNTNQMPSYPVHARHSPFPVATLHSATTDDHFFVRSHDSRALEKPEAPAKASQQPGFGPRPSPRAEGIRRGWANSARQLQLGRRKGANKQPQHLRHHVPSRAGPNLHLTPSDLDSTQSGQANKQRSCVSRGRLNRCPLARCSCPASDQLPCPDWPFALARLDRGCRQSTSVALSHQERRCLAG
ncbi:hypothetical protein J3F84DRAFT_71652 [Trichoderma pleuroticola]